MRSHKKLLKLIVIICAGILVFFIAAAMLLATLLDSDKLKSDLVQIVRDKTHRTLKIEGGFSLAFFPSLGLKTGKTSLSEKEGSKDQGALVSLENAHIAVAIMPLFRKQLVFTTIELTGLRGNIVRYADGTTNIDDLFAKNPNDPPARFDIGGLALSNATLTYLDEKARSLISLHILKLDAGHLANNAEGKLKIAAKITSSTPEEPLKANNHADLQLSAQYRYDLDKKTFDVSDLLLTVKPSDNAGGTTKIEAPKVAITPTMATIEPITVSFENAFENTSQNKNSQHIEAKLSLALSQIEMSDQVLSIGTIHLSGNARAGDTSLNFNMQSPLKADLRTRIAELPTVTSEFILAHPTLPTKKITLPVTAQIHADLARLIVTADLGAQLDTSKLAASVHIARFSPLTLDIDANIDQLNLDKYLPAKSETTSSASSPSDKATPPFDPAQLKGLNINGAIKIGTLEVAGVKAHKVRFDFKAAGMPPTLPPLQKKP